MVWSQNVDYYSTLKKFLFAIDILLQNISSWNNIDKEEKTATLQLYPIAFQAWAITKVAIKNSNQLR